MRADSATYVGVSSQATPATLASEIAAAGPGEVVCLASGDYSGFTGTSKSAPGITHHLCPGGDGDVQLRHYAEPLERAQNFTLDGTVGGGTMTVSRGWTRKPLGSSLQNKALNLAFQNLNFAAGASVIIQGAENSNITFNRDTFVAANANCSGSGGGPSGLSGIFYLQYSTTSTRTPSGVTVENSVFVAPADLWNPFRAIQTGAPMVVENNVFTGFLDHTEKGVVTISTLSKSLVAPQGLLAKSRSPGTCAMTTTDVSWRLTGPRTTRSPTTCASTSSRTV